MRFPRSRSLALTLLALTPILACSSGGNGDHTGPTGTISLQLAPSAASVPQGGQTQATGTLTRGGGFSGTVTFTVTGQPATVAATAGIPQTSGTVTTLLVTMVASQATPVGQYTITVRGQAAGLSDAVASFQLTVTAAPDYAIGVNPGAATMVQGTSRGDLAVSIDRTNFSDPVTLSLTGAPSGVTGTFSPGAPTGTASTMTLTVGAGAPIGTHLLMVSGTGAPGTRTAPFSLTITAAGSFVLALTPPGTVTLQQGASDASRTVTIARTNFLDPITLSAQGLPTGVTATFAPTPATGAAALMTLAATPGASVGGPSTVTITGDGPSALVATPHPDGAKLQSQVTFLLTIVAAPPPGSPVSIDFSGCTSANVPDKLFVQDGDGAWTMVTGTGAVYQFSLAQPKAGITRVLKNGSATTVDVFHVTRAELLAVQPFRFCQPAPARIRVHATIAGAGPGDLVNSSLRNWTNGSVGNGPVTLDPEPGPGDFIGYRHSLTGVGGSDRILILRDQNLPDQGSLGTIDLAGGAVAAHVAPMNLLGTMAGETRAHSMNYLTRATCDQAILYSNQAISGTTFSAYGSPPVPIARPTDFHEMMARTSIAGASRTATESFHALVGRALTLGPYLSPPTLTVLPAAYKRLEIQFVLPSEYGSVVSFQYNPLSPSRQVVLGASYDFLGGGGATTLSMPDFSGVAGWDNLDAPGPGQTGGWSLTATQLPPLGNRCVEGARSLTSTRSGGPF